ncbi:MAG TPA: Bro-N domain-containing protein [Candidatus Paceibacterota bacterium]|nr:Bro-N domain-containing protein [Candidatus Paceibacterota bacterium]
MRTNNMYDSTKIVLFQNKEVRKMFFNNEWYFSVIDIIEVLTDSLDPRDYWYKMKIRVKNEDQLQLSTICRQLKLIAGDGKMRETDCVNTENAFRLIQSIPSPKAEPFKRWLAKVGYERVKEIEDPELATKRTRMLYKMKGYSNEWIEKRMRGISIREELTDEWKSRGAENKNDYKILTSEISKATFGITPSQYKKVKNLKRENLRDHMDDFELIFTMLGERSTTEIHRTENSLGLPKLKVDAKSGGEIAGTARKELEKRIRRPIVSKDNFLPKDRKRKKLK